VQLGEHVAGCFYHCLRRVEERCENCQ
jgi:hypothetical protein